MGKTIERLATERGHEITYINSGEPLDQEKLKSCDVAIEFTRPEAAYANISALLRAGTPVVSGTTGWLAEKAAADDLARELGVGFVYASNFSLGVNLFFAMNEKLAQYMHPHTDYRPKVHEIHHTGKKDAPSGTAITAAEGVLAAYTELQGWSLNGESPQTLPITADRLDPYFGTHVVSYESPIDTLSLSHEAHSRDGFALGAIIAAEWIVDKVGPHDMRDVLGL